MFNPLYAAGPGRPVNVQRSLDPSLVGLQLQSLIGQMGAPYTGAPAGMDGITPGAPEPYVPGQKPEPQYRPTTMDRVTGAVSSFGANTDPTTQYGPEQFLGSAARGFAGVKNYLTSLQQQHAASQRQAQQDELSRRQAESEIAYRTRIGGTGTAPKYGGAEWIPDPTDPKRQLWASRNPTTGAAEPVLLDGQRVTRDTPVSRSGNIDPLSPEGIAASGRRARVVAEAQQAGASAAQQQSFAGYDALLEGADNVERLLNERPQGVGLKFWGGDEINQRIDPEGTALRAAIADVRSVLLFARSGGAVSEGEAERIAPLLPKPTDTPEAIRAKLPQLRLAVIRLRDALRRQLTANPQGSGRTAPPGYVPLPQE